MANASVLPIQPVTCTQATLVTQMTGNSTLFIKILLLLLYILLTVCYHCFIFLCKHYCLLLLSHFVTARSLSLLTLSCNPLSLPGHLFFLNILYCHQLTIFLNRLCDIILTLPLLLNGSFTNFSSVNSARFK